ncbi:hypothetical protein SAMN05216466_106178 [Paraburkholderia phenazinium]|uniref:Large polyvalent protein associated domain-containing protein n=1 Tax=Paraburkholderia phenazinium TaxID=60549 RepID=A0A1G7YGX5_9BURK|nr:hypothetical protein [Paraburkholderia phenazinium]SDG95614.1 hypothetical protein SAMN05216466_106178 [Paraburkholderia phenazinium]
MKHRTLSLPATLKLLRNALRETFPAHAIDASPSPSGRCGITVTWCDGPTVPQVQQVLRSFSLGGAQSVLWHSFSGAPVTFKPYITTTRSTSGQPVDPVVPQPSATLAGITTFDDLHAWTLHVQHLDEQRRGDRLVRRLDGPTFFAAVA